GTAGGSRSTGGGAGTGGVSSTGAAPGVTADKIYVGLSYTVNASAANNAIGAAGISQGDPHANDEAIISDINAHGRIAGRNVVAVDPNGAGTSNARCGVLDQQPGDDWPRAHNIFAPLAEAQADSDTPVGCLNSRGVSFVTPGFSTPAAARFRRSPAY